MPAPMLVTIDAMMLFSVRSVLAVVDVWFGSCAAHICRGCCCAVGDIIFAAFVFCVVALVFTMNRHSTISGIASMMHSMAMIQKSGSQSDHFFLDVICSDSSMIMTVSGAVIHASLLEKPSSARKSFSQMKAKTLIWYCSSMSVLEFRTSVLK